VAKNGGKRRWRGLAQVVWKEEERASKRGPRVSSKGREKPERAKGATQKRKHKPENMPRVRGLTGPARDAVACKGRGADVVNWVGF
jgi:hypothetical protein